MTYSAQAFTIKALTRSTPIGSTVGFKDDVEQYGTLEGWDSHGFAIISGYDDETDEPYTITLPTSSCWVG